jgi:hypothetical protein
MADLTQAQRKVRSIINERLDSIESWIAKSRSCLADDDYFQTAVRIMEAGKICQFDEDMLQLFELLSEEQ